MRYNKKRYGKKRYGGKKNGSKRVFVKSSRGGIRL
jgi:hypothetical protein